MTLVGTNGAFCVERINLREGHTETQSLVYHIERILLELFPRKCAPILNNSPSLYRTFTIAVQIRQLQCHQLTFVHILALIGVGVKETRANFEPYIKMECHDDSIGGEN